MNKLYAGLAAAAIVTSGIACGAGAAGATGPGWPSPLGYSPQSTVSAAAGADGAVYTAALTRNGVDLPTIDVTSSTPDGTPTHTTVTLTPQDGYVVDYILGVAISSTGTLVVSARESTGDADINPDFGLWMASSGDATAHEAFAHTGAGYEVAVSPNGQYAALGDSGVTTFDLAGGSSPATTDLTSDGTSNTNAIAVTDTGTAYVAGTAGTSSSELAPVLWTVSGGAVAATSDLSADPESIAVSGGSVLVGETDAATDATSYSLQVLNGSTTHTVALPYNPASIAVSGDGHTAWAADTETQRVMSADLTNLASYTSASQIPVADGWYQVFGVAAHGSTLDVVGQQSTWVPTDDDPDGEWVNGLPSVFSVTEPAAVGSGYFDKSDDDGDTTIDASWAAPADHGGAPLTYLVTVTDASDGSVIHVEGTTNVTGDAGYVHLNQTDGLKADDTYTMAVTAYNGQLGQTVALLPYPDVIVDGDATAGGILTASVDGWDSAVQLTYQWYVLTKDADGDITSVPIAGGNEATFTPTADLVGDNFKVEVTGTEAGFAPLTVTGWSPNVGDDEAPDLPGDGTITITGSPVEGATLTAMLSSTWPTTATVGYQWFVVNAQGESADLDEIAGATHSTLQLTHALVGKKIAVVVTASEDGYSDAYAYSHAFGPVAAASSGSTTQVVTTTKAATIKSSAKKVTVTLAGVTGSAPGKVKVYDGKKLIGKATIKDGKVTLKLKKHLAKGKHHLTMKYAGSAQVAAFHQKATLKVK